MKFVFGEKSIPVRIGFGSRLQVATSDLALVPSLDMALIVCEAKPCCHTLLPSTVDGILHLAELLPMTCRCRGHMFLVKEDVTPIFVFVKIICKMQAPIQIGECITWHLFLQQHDGINWALRRTTIANQWKSLECTALLTSNMCATWSNRMSLPLSKSNQRGFHSWFMRCIT